MRDSDLKPSVVESFEMAKKKSAPEPPKQNQKVLVTYKADPQTFDAYKEWLDDLASHVGAPLTITMDMALKAFAERSKFRPPPKRLAR